MAVEPVPAALASRLKDLPGAGARETQWTFTPAAFPALPRSTPALPAAVAVYLAPQGLKGQASARCRPAQSANPRPLETGSAKFKIHGVLAHAARQGPLRRIRPAQASRWAVRHYLAVAATVLLGAVLSLGALAGIEARRPPPEFIENFTAGLADWEGRGSASWTIDRKGFARPGRLALFSPSSGLGDYRLEFRALIESKSMGCVFRAAGPDDYHVVLLSRTKPGYVSLERFSVIAGKPEPRKSVGTPIKTKGTEPFGITILAKGPEFTLYANSEPVDHWFDGRLPAGGTGFYGDPGGRARLYGVQLTAQGGLTEKLRRLMGSTQIAASGVNGNANSEYRRVD